MPRRQAELSLGTLTPPILTLMSLGTGPPLSTRNAVFLAFATSPFEAMYGTDYTTCKPPNSELIILIIFVSLPGWYSFQAGGYY